MGALRSYRVPDLGICFVDREQELRALLEITEKPYTDIVLLYGPWGCGKTEFMRAFTRAVEECVDCDLVCIYLNPLEEKRAEWGLRVTRLDLDRLLAELFGKTLSELISMLSVPELVLRVAKMIGKLLSCVVEKFGFRDRRLIVFIDEVEKVLEYRNFTIGELVTSLYNGRGLREELGLKSLVYVIATSDQVIIEDALREQGKCHIYLMWHLDLDSARELCRVLELADIDTVLKLTGGCPRAIVDIRHLSLKNWLDNVIARVRAVIAKARAELGYTLRDILKEVGRIVEDVDTFDVDMRLKMMLVRENILIYLTPGRLSRIERAHWVGKYWAWQIPAYYYISKAMCEHGLDVEAEHILHNLES